MLYFYGPSEDAPSEDAPPVVKNYYMEFQKDGPDAMTTDNTFGIYPVPDAEFHDSKFLEVVEFAVNEHNAHCQLVEHQSLELVRVVKANYRLSCSRTRYYITLEAMNHAKSMKQFQAAVDICDAGCKALVEFHVFPSDTGSLSDEQADDEFWNALFRRHAPEAICENEKDPKGKFYNPRYKTVCRRTYAEEESCYHDLLCDPDAEGLARSPYHLLRPSPTAFVPGCKADKEVIAKIRAEHFSASGSNDWKQHLAVHYSLCPRIPISSLTPFTFVKDMNSATEETTAAQPDNSVVLGDGGFDEEANKEGKGWRKS